MGTVREHRLAHFKALLQKEMARGGKKGAQARLAQKVGMAPSIASQIATGYRQIGDVLARRIESKMGWERGALDRPPTGSSPSSKINRELLVYLIAQLEDAVESAEGQATPESKAAIISEVYDLYSGTGEKPTRALILQFVRRGAV